MRSVKRDIIQMKRSNIKNYFVLQYKQMVKKKNYKSNDKSRRKRKESQKLCERGSAISPIPTQNERKLTNPESNQLLLKDKDQYNMG